MSGKNPLLVARQHGHSVETMWRIYSGWMDDAPESDIEAIKHAMGAVKPTASAALPHLSVQLRGFELTPDRKPISEVAETNRCTGFATGTNRAFHKRLFTREIKLAERVWYTPVRPALKINEL
jgi:hypothetical protein